MQMHPVKSSNIESIGHDGDTMHVRFKNGGTYSYTGVTAEGFRRLKEAPSVGKHLAKMNVSGKKL
jgi:KTSC domain